jgi:hypothetical protein
MIRYAESFDQTLDGCSLKLAPDPPGRWIEVDPKIDARGVASGPYVERGISFAEVIRISFIDHLGLLVVPVGRRLRRWSKSP